MQKLSTLIVATIVLTAIVSTSLSFILFQHFAVTANPTTEASISSELVNYKNTNIKPAALPGNFVETAREVTPAIVNVSSRSRGFGGSNGSGVIISEDGYIITNYHVIEGATSLTITLNDKRDYQAEVIGIDPTTDLALLKIEAAKLPTLSFGNSDVVEVGEWVVAVGNPFNLASTVTAGIVSAKGRSINISSMEYSIESFIQTDAVVNPGNSGGALVNAKGQLVGINSAIITESGSYEGYSFAIPSNLVRKVIADLREYGEVKRAILGVVIQDVSDKQANELGLSKVAGVMIQSVRDNSTAAIAGLQSGDVILKVNGKEVRSTPELQEQVGRYRPGDRISLDYMRNGRLLKKDNIRLKALE